MLLLLLCLSFAAENPNYVLVLRNNQKMTIKEPPNCQGRTCTVIMPDGSKKLLPRGLIDRDRTDAYNQHLADVRAKEEAARLEAEAAAKQAAEEAAAHETPKEIVLRDVESLPKFDRAQNATSGTVKPNPGSGSGKPENVVVNEKTSNAEVYVGKETISTFEKFHKIDLELRTKATVEVTKVEVSAKVRFESEAAQTFKMKAPKETFGYGEVVNVSFQVNSSDTILGVDYNVNYMTEVK